MLRTAKGEEALPTTRESLYGRSVRLFQDAVAGQGAPAATGEDGVKSLGTALSAVTSAQLGHEIPVILDGDF